MTKEQEALLLEAKLLMMRTMPYFGTYVVGMDLIVNNSVPTAATDYRTIIINPDYVMGGGPDGRLLRTVGEVVFIFAHETLHVTFKHGMRRGFRDPELWNVAADYAINLILDASQIGTFPTFHPQLDKGAVKLLDPKFAGMSAETIYDLLEKERQKQGGGSKFKMGRVVIDLSKDDPGGTGGFVDPKNIDGSDLTDAQKSILERSVDSRTSSAAAAAKQAGKLPAGLEAFIETALKSKVDWRERLRQFAAKQFPSDLSWARPNRRYVYADLYLPYTEKKGVGKILVIMDTSGSVGYESPESEGAQYFSEIKAIFEDVMPEELHVMYCDAEVAGYDIFAMGEEPKLNPRGREGTDFRPPFDKIKKDGIDIQCAIYLTDGYGPFPEKPMPYPVLWVITTDVVPPWGEHVPLKLD